MLFSLLTSHCDNRAKFHFEREGCLLATFIVYFHYGCSEKRGNIEEVYISDMVEMMEVCGASFGPMQKAMSAITRYLN